MRLLSPNNKILLTRPLIVVGLAIGLFTLTGCVQHAVPTAPGGSKSITRSTAVPAPGGGTIHQAVPSVATGATTRVSLSKPAVLPSKVTISIVSATETTVKATTPGEIAGPAIVATVLIKNGTSATLDLGSTVVNLLQQSGAPGEAMTSTPFKPFTQTVAAGQSLQGVYVFRVPSSGFNPVKISVSYAGGAPVALFSGDVS